ncbi:MAG: ATP-binding cassette domain-containing protein, partial [Hyphomicrobiaceae bacterium]
MGKNVIGMQPRDVTKLGLCRSFQIPQVFLSGTVLQNMMIAYGLAEEHGFGLLAQLYSDARVQRVEEHMARFKIGDYRGVPTGELPQGVRKLVDIAMATVRQPRLLMLDEPTSGISVEEKFGLMDIIMAVLKQERTTVLFIEHDMEIVERYVSRVLAFYQGAIICDAPTAEAMQNESVKEFVVGHNPIGNGNA